MITLYIDTSSSYLYTGIVKDDTLIASIKEDLEHSMSSLAIVKISEMFKNTNLKPKNIDKIIVVNGPGSFTGIRVGLTIAKVYAFSLNIPITTITSLEAMALSINSKSILVPIINARRGYVYTAAYEKEKELLKPQHIQLIKLYEYLDNKDNYIYITNDDIELNSKICRYDPDILRIVNKYCRKDAINPHMVNPEYLKLTEAEENKL